MSSMPLAKATTPYVSPKPATPKKGRYYKVTANASHCFSLNK